MKFHENPSSGSQIVPCGWKDGQRDMTKPTAAFRNFTNSPPKRNAIHNPAYGTVNFSTLVQN